MYKGQIFPNNSVILYDYGSNISIQCVTNLRPCCTAREQGEWYEPDYLSERNVSLDRISRYDNGTVAMIPLSHHFGLHHCVLPNATNKEHHIYFGIYELFYPCKTITTAFKLEIYGYCMHAKLFSNADLNSYVPRIEQMVYNASSHTLTCISRGSPATIVIWRRNGVVINDDEDVYERTQVISHISRSEYKNQLTGDFNIAGITCQVSNTSQIYPIIGKLGTA